MASIVPLLLYMCTRHLHPTLPLNIPSIQAKIVRQETTNIDALYDRKRKQVEIQKKM